LILDFCCEKAKDQHFRLFILDTTLAHTSGERSKQHYGTYRDRNCNISDAPNANNKQQGATRNGKKEVRLIWTITPF
jgi:hypothetical protein